jgi:hypothetical protein
MEHIISCRYGNNKAEMDEVRNKTGKGLLYPDCFSDDRMLFLPPAAGVLLVLFNRNHNVSDLPLPVGFLVLRLIMF